MHVHQLRWQHFCSRVLRVALLPVGNAGFQHVRIAAVVEPHLLQIQPALQDIFIGVDHQRSGLILGHGGECLPGCVNIFLLVRTREQRLLGNQRAEKRQGGATLLSGDTGLPETGLLILIQRAQFDSAEDLLRAVEIFLRDLQFCRQQRLLMALIVVKILRQLAEQLGGLLGFSFLQQRTNGE
ncbi:Uncharacterised protein [Enterobacter hormaechei]|nr:Uncharacterised protein [Enterobacter hormaechei]